MEAITRSVADSLAEERERGDMSASADRTSLVHQRTGQPCPVCGDTIRAVEYRSYTVLLLPDLPDRRQDPGRQHPEQVRDHRRTGEAAPAQDAALK